MRRMIRADRGQAVSASDIGGWTDPVPTTVVGTTEAQRMAQAQAGTRLYYISNSGTDPTSAGTWAGTGVFNSASTAGEVYFWSGTAIVDSQGNTSPSSGAGAGTAYGSDPLHPNSSVKAFQHWSFVGPSRTGTSPGVTDNNGVGNEKFTAASGRVDSPDWWLFKAGDTFDLALDLAATTRTLTSTFGLAVPGGASSGTGIQVMGRYGPLATARPKFTHPPASGLGFLSRDEGGGGIGWKNVLYFGLEFNGHDRATGAAFGVSIFNTQTTGTNIVFEDMHFNGMDSWTFDSNQGAVTLRRCILKDSWRGSGNVTGMHSNDFDNFTLQIEDCLVGRNGFHSDPSTTNPAFDGLSRNFYLAGAINRAASHIKNTVVLYGASGEQFRCGMPCENVFFLGDVDNSVQGGTAIYPDADQLKGLEITSMTGNGTTVTVTTNAVALGYSLLTDFSACGFPKNMYISRASISAFNGAISTASVSVTGAGTFTYSSTASGSPTGAYLSLHNDTLGHVGVPPFKNCVVQTFINPTNLKDAGTSADAGSGYGGGGFSVSMGWTGEEVFGNIVTTSGTMTDLGQTSGAGGFGLGWGSQGKQNIAHYVMTGMDIHDNICFGSTSTIPLSISAGMAAGTAGSASYDSYASLVPVIVGNTLRNHIHVGATGATTAWHTYSQLPGGSATDDSSTTETTGLTRYATKAAALSGQPTWTNTGVCVKTIMQGLTTVTSKDGTDEAYAIWDTMQRGQWRSDMYAKTWVNAFRAGFGQTALP